MTADSRARNGKSPGEGAAPELFNMPEWVRPLSETPLQIYATLGREALGAAARGLQAQADYVRDLASCDGPVEFMECQNAFVRKSIGNGYEEGRRFVEALQTPFGAGKAKE